MNQQASVYQAGVIGLGQIAWSIDDDPQRKGIWSHVGAYAESENTTLQAVSSRDEETCKKVQANYAIPAYYTDYRAMLDAEELDIVSICTPIKTHYDIVMACIDAGVKAIFCEKTLSFDVSEAEAMVSACDEKGIVLAVNFVRRWDSLYRHIGDLLSSGTIGELQTAVCYGSTALHTSASHLIDVMCWYAGTPRWVVGEEADGFVRSVHGVEDPGGIGMVRFDSGVVGFIKGSSPSPKEYMSELDLVGTAGRIRITGDGAQFSVYRFGESDAAPGSGYEILVEQEAASPGKNERMVDAIGDIVQCIENKRQPESSGYSSLCSLRVIDGIRRSSRDGNCRIDI